MEKFTFGFIGCGNMGGTLLKAVAKKFPKTEICCYDKIIEKSNEMSDFATVLSGSCEVAEKSRIIFIGVKPQFYEDCFAEINGGLSNNLEGVIVSMAAGVSISGVEKLISTKRAIIRIMPNTPCQFGKGVILYDCNNFVTDDQRRLFLDSMQSCGLVDNLEEGLIDVASVISGCGPAFVYMYIDALKKAGVKLGLDDEKALNYAVKTVEGSAVTVQNSTKSVSDLIKAVCSPGGTTIEGVNYFEENGLYELVEKALNASYKKTLKLKK